jgi:hypothetical protein
LLRCTTTAATTVAIVCSYDFFMGAILHPRLFGGRLDIKMFAGARRGMG